MTDDYYWNVVDRLDDMVRDHLRWIQDSEVVDDSAIDPDDRQFTVMSLRELADSSVKASLDCIFLACASLLAVKGVRGIGYPALARTAITAGTTALRLLHDDVTIRRTRALQLPRAQCAADHTYVDGRRALDEFLPDKAALMASRKKRLGEVFADAKR